MTSPVSASLEGRRSGEQVVQQQAHREHVALGRIAAHAQVPRIQHAGQRLGAAGNSDRLGRRAECRAGGRCTDHGAQCGNSGVTLLVDEQVMKLQILMNDTAVVGEGQPLERLVQQVDCLDGCRPRVGLQPLGQRKPQAPLDRQVGPVVLHPDFGHRRQVRVIQPRRHASLVQPCLEARCVGWLHSRHVEHELPCRARVDRQPRHRGAALAEQLPQLEPSERARRVRVRQAGGSSVGGHDWSGVGVGVVVSPLGHLRVAGQAAIRPVKHTQFRSGGYPPARHASRPSECFVPEWPRPVIDSAADAEGHFP